MSSHKPHSEPYQISDETRALMERIPKAERPEADIVREKITEAFPNEGILAHLHRGSHGRPAYYTLMAPVSLDPNTLVEKFEGLANAQWAETQYVERWNIAKDLFAKHLTPDIKREQPFASFTAQITGNIRHHFHEMAQAQFSGEGGTHYIIDGVAPGMDPARLLTRAGTADEFRQDEYWRVKISQDDMRAALGLPAQERHNQL